MSNYPKGTATFLLTEVENSAALWESYPVQMRSSLQRQDEILRGIVGDHGGRMFGVVGDAYRVAFDRPTDALRAAISVQRTLFSEEWARPLNLRVRMALHAGVPDRNQDGAYSGASVEGAARLVSAAHGGQVLLSDATRVLVGENLASVGAGAELEDLGEHVLKGLTRPERVFQLAVPDLPARFPPPRTGERAADLVDGRYRIKDFLGSGGMAKVYLAYDERMRREVAIKMLHPRYAEDEEFVRRFEREAYNAASLSHPNLVQVFDRGEREDGAPYIVMEYLPGGTLKDLVSREAPLSPRRAVALALQIAEALSEAHSKGVVHRDVKPQNVLFGEKGNLKVADFGIARAVDSTTLTGTGVVLGTPHYIAPEQSEGRPATPRSDLYALGVVFYEMLAGRLPYDADTPAGVLSQQLRGQARSPREVNPNVPSRVDDVAARLLARNPEDRYRDASGAVPELERALRSIGEGDVPAAERSVSMGRASETKNPADASTAALSLPSTVRVPDLTGQDAFQASSALAELGLTLGDQKEVASDIAPKGIIVAQSIETGTETEPGGMVSVAVSSGSGGAGAAERGKTPQGAIEEASAGADAVAAGRREASDVGNARSPEDGRGSAAEKRRGSDRGVRHAPPQRRVRMGSLIVVLAIVVVGLWLLSLLARAGQAIEVPSVESQTLAAARQEVGGVFELVSSEITSDEPEGTIVDQDPEPGARVEPGGRIAVVLSAGPETVPVPDVVGETRNEAENLLRSEGFGVSMSYILSSEGDAGRVIEQYPAGGDAEKGSRVVIAIGGLPAETTMMVEEP